ncbi:hypothetical protein ACO0LV_00375 [Pseudactinotalea sp. Z1739]|uniref:hypothetical protein n=1 Tax=Pseudactinotalea sp. Z1739 TaxID=3413028 RepID=UPI003C7DD77F
MAPSPLPQPRHSNGDEASLNELLAEAERTVERLRQELAQRQQVRAEKELTAAQHAEIDRLTEHLANAQVHWGQVRSFFAAAMAELVEPESGTQEPGGQHQPQA